MQIQSSAWWEIDGNRAYRRYMKMAVRAAKKGIPDPSRSVHAPTCFHGWLSLCSEMVHQQAGALLDACEEDIVFLKAHWDVREASSSLYLYSYMDGLQRENDLRRIWEVSQRRSRLGVRFGRYQTEVASLGAMWSRGAGNMLDAFRAAYIYGDHIGRIQFPELDIQHIQYEAFGGVNLNRLLNPDSREGHEPPSGELTS